MNWWECTPEDLIWRNKFLCRLCDSGERVKKWKAWQKAAKLEPKKWQIMRMKTYVEWTVALLREGEFHQVMTFRVRLPEGWIRKH